MPKTKKNSKARSSKTASKKTRSSISPEALMAFNEFFAMGIESGLSIPSALEQSAKYGDATLRREIETCLQGFHLGQSLEESMTALSERVGSSNFDLAVGSILLAKESGGTPVPFLRALTERLSRR